MLRLPDSRGSLSESTACQFCIFATSAVRNAPIHSTARTPPQQRMLRATLCLRQSYSLTRAIESIARHSGAVQESETPCSGCWKISRKSGVQQTADKVTLRKPWSKPLLTFWFYPGRCVRCVRRPCSGVGRMRGAGMKPSGTRLTFCPQLGFRAETGHYASGCSA